MAGPHLAPEQATGVQEGIGFPCASPLLAGTARPGTPGSSTNTCQIPANNQLTVRWAPKSLTYDLHPILATAWRG